MGKYNDLYMCSDEMQEISALIETLTVLENNAISIDHIQVGDSNGDILGKVQFAHGGWRFHPRKHDKPGVLGE